MRIFSSLVIPALQTCERITWFFPRLPRMAMRARRNRCLVWGSDVSPDIRRPREGAPSVSGRKIVGGRALYRTQARPARKFQVRDLGGRREAEFADVKSHRTGHGYVSYRLLRGSHITRHGDVPRPIFFAQAKGSGTCMVKPRGGTARVNAEVCFEGKIVNAGASSPRLHFPLASPLPDWLFATGYSRPPLRSISWQTASSP